MLFCLVQDRSKAFLSLCFFVFVRCFWELGCGSVMGGFDGEYIGMVPGTVWQEGWYSKFVDFINE